jgi:bifunctional non-homologous end joining protein LigD
VSTPLAWQEVAAATEPEDLVFRAPDVLERVAERGDLFAGVVELEQQLPEAL